MKKILLSLTLLGMLGVAAPATACEGGKCTMDHSTKESGKKKKSKKAASKDKTCQMATSGTKSCCAKPAATTTETKQAQ